MAIKTYGTMAVDWEQRIDFDRLRRERLARVKEQLAKSEIGALLCFDMNNVRYITSTHIGTWAQDKIAASRCFRRTTSRFSGTSGRPPAITSSTARGSASGRARASACCAAR